MSDYLESLDSDQLKAVLHPPVPTKILAGAGSGKTRLLVARIAHQIETGLADPSLMFVSAFTRSAADEMDERIRHLVDAEDLLIRTFHGLMFGFLNDERRYTNLPALNVCKPGEQQRIIQGLLGKKSKDWPQGINVDADVSHVSSMIGMWKNELFRHDSDQIKQTLLECDESTDDWAAATIYPLYEEHLEKIGKLDFDDMLCKSYDLLAADSHALDRAQARWNAFSIDEAQDFNRAQMEIIKLIAPASNRPNITMVGDVKQALYRFRGAVPELMEDFSRDYKADTILLARNYRSTSKITDAANKIAHVFNEPQTSQRHEGDDLIGVSVLSEVDQALEIAEFVRSSREKGRKGGETAVLIRTNAQSAEIERAFVAAKLPYWCAGGGFFDHMEIGDLMAYLRLALDHTDVNALNRIINRPTRYLGKAFVDQVQKNSSNYGDDLVTAIRFTTRYAGKSLWAKQLEAAQDLAELLDDISPAENSIIHARLAIQKVMDETGYMDWLRTTSGTSEGADDSRKENIDALLSIAAQFGSISALVKFADEAAELQIQSGDATEICTVHRSKGREWPIVFVANFFEDSFPHKHSMMGGPTAMDDERRVAYVAFTRAQDHLIVMCPESDSFGEKTQPSRFLQGLELELLPLEDSGLVGVLG